MKHRKKDNGKNRVSGYKQQVVALCQQGDFEQAKQLLETIERQQGMDADAYFLLATIYGQQTRFDDAVAYYDRALELAPRQLRSRVGRAKALLRLGRYDEAIKTYERALTDHPDTVALIEDLANLLLNLGRFEQAEKWALQALKLAPESEKILTMLGRVYQSMRRPELALSYYERALKSKPDFAEGHYLLGMLLFNQGRTGEAEHHYHKALDDDARNVGVLKSLGYLYLCTNRPPEARNMLQRALDLQPQNPDVIATLARLDDQSGDVESAWQRIRPFIERNLPNAEMGFVFADICRHFDRCRDAADYLEQMIDRLPKQPEIREKLYFALGKLYDRMGEYDSAFSYYDQGNQLKPDAYNLVEEAACVDELIRLCDWNFFVQAPRSALKTDSPLFIVGMPRSGTTLVEQILASHPNVVGLGEIIVFPEIIKNLKSYTRSNAPYPANLKKLTPAILDTLGNTYLEGVRKLGWTNQRLFTDKTLVNYLYLGLLALMFPNTRVVHCVRDPRDTCLSIFFQNFDESHYYATRLDNLGAHYTQYRRVMNHWKSLLTIPILELRYEDLVSDQEGKTRELVDFAGLEWDDRVLSFYETKRSVVTASYDQVRQKIYKGSTARWKNYEKHIDPLLNAFGFPLEESSHG